MVMENIQEIKNLVQEIKLKRQNRLWNNIFRAYNPCSEIWLDKPQQCKLTLNGK